MAEVACPPAETAMSSGNLADVEVVAEVAAPSAGEAASSSAEGSTGKAPYISVQFDDGPEFGILSELSESDRLDPKYWQFNDLHNRCPCAKVLFSQGVSIFIAEWPSALAGELVDEDGDSHQYVRQDGPVEPASQPRQTARQASAPRRQSAGGYGYYTVDYTKEEEDENQEVHDKKKAPSSKARRRREDLDEDWTYNSHNSKNKRAKTRVVVEKAVRTNKAGAKRTAKKSKPESLQSVSDVGISAPEVDSTIGNASATAASTTTASCVAASSPDVSAGAVSVSLAGDSCAAADADHRAEEVAAPVSKENDAPLGSPEEQVTNADASATGASARLACDDCSTADADQTVPALEAQASEENRTFMGSAEQAAEMDRQEASAANAADAAPGAEPSSHNDDGEAGSVADSNPQGPPSSSTEPMASAGSSEAVSHDAPVHTDSLDFQAGQVDIDIDPDADSDVEVDYSDAGSKDISAGPKDPAPEHEPILLDKDIELHPVEPHLGVVEADEDDFEMIEELPSSLTS